MWRLLFVGLLGGTGLVLGVEWGPVWVGLAGGGGVGATALVTWLLGRRRQSGSVRSSEAGELWSAYDRIQERTERALERVEKEKGVFREENGQLRERVAVLEREVDRLLPLEAEVERLRGIVNGHD